MRVMVKIEEMRLGMGPRRLMVPLHPRGSHDLPWVQAEEVERAEEVMVSWKEHTVPAMWSATRYGRKGALDGPAVKIRNLRIGGESDRSGKCRQMRTGRGIVTEPGKTTM